MRIGEILIEAGWIKPADLTSALDYSKTRAVPIGRILQLLKCVTEDQVQLALAAQKHIRAGLSSTVALPAMLEAYSYGLPFELGLEQFKQNGGHAASTPPPPRASTLTVNWPPPSAVSQAAQPKLSESVQGLIESADKAAKENRNEEATVLYRAAIAKDAANNITKSPSIRLLTKFANFLFAIGNFEEAEQNHNLIIKLGKATWAKDDPQIAKSLEEFADLCTIAEKYEQAAQLYLETIDAIELRLPSSLPDYLHTMRKLSKITKHLAKGDVRPKLGSLLVQAELMTEAQLQEALQAAKRAAKPLGLILQELKFVSPQNLASVMHCQLVLEEGRVNEGLALRALKLAIKQDMNLKTFLSGANIPPREEDSPEYKELALSLDALLALETAGNADSIEAAEVCLKLGTIYRRRNALYDSEFSFKRSSGIFKSKAPNTVQCAQAAIGYSSALVDRKKYAEAHAVLSEALTNLRATESMESADILRLLSICESNHGSPATALSFGQSAAAVMDKIGYPDGPEKAVLMETLSDCYADCANNNMAQSFLNRALAIVAKYKTEESKSECERLNRKLATIKC